MRAISGRAVPPPVLLAIGLTVIAQLELWVLWVPDPDEATRAVPLAVRAVAALGSLPLTASLGLGRRLPLLSLALAIPAVALLPSGPLETSIAFAVALAFAAFRAAIGTARPVDALMGMLGIVGVVGTTILVHPGPVEEVGDLALLGIVLIGPWLAGSGIQVRQEREATLETAAARAESARQAEAAAAVAGERARIARELHDVVAHAISVIVLQARGGRRTLRRDPDAAAQALDVIEATASRALGEMRRLVDVLRPGEGSGALEPTPGLAELDGLVSGVRAAGLHVDLRIEGEPVELAPGIDLAAYRLVQEALTNALQHAARPATVRVVVRYRTGEVEVEVSDDGPGGSPEGTREQARAGHGMIGMRERAALYGGSVEFGPRPGGGFGVVGRLPVGPETT